MPTGYGVAVAINYKDGTVVTDACSECLSLSGKNNPAGIVNLTSTVTL